MQPVVNSEVQITGSIPDALLAVAASQWAGVGGVIGVSGLIYLPNGVAGSAARLAGVVAPNFPLDHIAAGWQVDGSQQDGNAGASKGGFDNQSVFADIGTSIAWNSMDEWSPIDQVGLNGNSALSSDSHAVQAQPNAELLGREGTSLLVRVEQKNASLESDVVKHRSLVDDRAIGIVNLNVGLDLSAPSGEGAIADSDVLDVQKLSLEPFQLVSIVLGHGGESVGPDTFFNAASNLSQGQGQQNQNALQHNPSFGPLTLPPDRNLVNTSVGNGQWSVVSGLPAGWSLGSDAVTSDASPSTSTSTLTSEQLMLLGRATITIADLADGYLALTTGTTITLDTDAAGYGWFIDSTPTSNDEFLPSILISQYSCLVS